MVEAHLVPTLQLILVKILALDNLDRLINQIMEMAQHKIARLCMTILCDSFMYMRGVDIRAMRQCSLFCMAIQAEGCGL